jgi:hypothetical protein
MTVTETVQCQFNLSITAGNETLFSQSYPILLMPYNHWQGAEYHPELTAAFVTPHHPLIDKVMSRASEILREQTNNPSLYGFLAESIEGKRTQIKAVYDALKEEHIRFQVSSAATYLKGQQVRMVDDVLRNKLGNCVDLTLLFCSCMERLNLSSVFICYDTHVIPAVWLERRAIPPMVGYDYRFIRHFCLEDDRVLLPLESTVLTENYTFEQAVECGMKTLDQFARNFILYVDLFSCRANGILPLPHFIQKEGVTTLAQDTPGEEKTQPGSTSSEESTDSEEHTATTHKSNEPGSSAETSADEPDQKSLAKLKVWERRLLDLSMRNKLLNMDRAPLLLRIESESIENTLTQLQEGQLQTLVQIEKKKKKNEEDEDEQDNSFKNLYRAARNAMEESGSNAFFLTLGSLKWIDESSQEAYHAPILMVPVELVRQHSKRFIIKRLDNEPTINVTLLEFLRQTFQMTSLNFSSLPFDDNGEVDYATVFQQFREAIEGQDNWEVEEESRVGIFSFTNFAMWNDIHNHYKEIMENPILQSFLSGKITADFTDHLRFKELDDMNPTEYAIPIDVDSSQLKAVVDSCQMRAFTLYGPPGTGKSQTITNMIANALYQGKRVLFVAEKQAALEVVQNRLTQIGLSPFCLELHSNKTEKKCFLGQLSTALQVDHKQHNLEVENRAAMLLAQRQRLNQYVKSVHQKREDNLSLFDCINHYLEVEGEPIEVDYAWASSVGQKIMESICEELKQLDTVITILHKHPAEHPLRNLLPVQNTIDNQQQITELIDRLPGEIAEAEKKAEGILNRWIFKKTPLQIVEQLPDFQKLKELAYITPSITDNLETLKQELELWRANKSSLRLWYHYSIAALELMEYPSSPAMEYFMQGKSGKETAMALRKGFFQSIATYIIEHDEELRAFNGMLFEQVIERYREYSQTYQELTKEEIYCRLAAQVPRADELVHDDEEFVFLKKRIANGGRGMSIRRILGQIPHLLPRLTPCMLMSPISVSQYLNMNDYQFDLVIFDEASQVPTCEAVGAIARAKSVVVVGDPKQMPPTSFFMANSISDEEADMDDLESVLDDFISLGYPARHLNWHYRSRHESLITFSNNYFYDGQLITFPSTDDQSSKVTFQFVEGCYDHGRTRSNKAEAAAIVEDVLQRLRSQMKGESPVASIGIVAFSSVQSMKIEDMLMDALAKDKKLENFMMQSPEPLFVKNLENVQGDERDIILFSVGYGPDVDGKVSMNFGPLNRIGGERRLNVAITRARQEMKVFSTILPQQIDLSRTSSVGVTCLKRFLEYAISGQLVIPQKQLQPNDPEQLTKEIEHHLTDMGYSCHVNVGKSNFKVNVAISLPEHPETYILGILIDGYHYAQTLTARDREIVQPKVLHHLGWNILKVWSVDWFCDKEIVLQQIQRVLEDIQSEERAKEEAKAAEETKAAEEAKTAEEAEQESVEETSTAQEAEVEEA